MSNALSLICNTRAILPSKIISEICYFAHPKPEYLFRQMKQILKLLFTQFLCAVYIVHGSQHSCSEDWTLLGESKCVSAIKKPTAFATASQICADDDAQVVSITSDDEVQ